MADMYENLAANDPEGLEKLKQLRDALRMSQPYDAEQASRSAQESAYGDVFGKQIAQDAVDAASIPGKTAADSASVFSKAMPAGIEEGKNVVPYSQLAKTGAEDATKLLPAAESEGGKDALTALFKILPGAAEGGASLASKGLSKALPIAGQIPMLYGDLAEDQDKPKIPAGMAYDPKSKKLIPSLVSDKESDMPSKGLSKEDLLAAAADYKKGQDSPGRGPAADVGVNPSEEETISPAVAEKKPPRSKEAQDLQDTLDKATGKKEVSQRMDTSDAIKALLGKSDEDFDAAAHSRGIGQLIASLGQAGSTIGAAMSPMANIKPNNEFFERLSKQAGQPIEDLAAKQASKRGVLQNLSLEKQLGDQMAKDDPNSAISKFSVDLAKAAAKQAKLGIKIPDNVSMSQLEKLMPGIEGMANRRIQMETNMAARQVAHGQKIDDKANAAMGHTITSLESARGNPEVSLALRNRLLVKNARSLINQYGDPNKMPPAQLALLATEVGKIASGGVPGHAELQAIMPNTMKEGMARLASKFTNEVTSANAGAFIKEYNKYLSELEHNANNSVRDKYNRVIESSKKQLGQENYDTLKKQYLDPYEASDQKEAAQASGPHGDTVTQGGHTYTWNAKTGKYE